MIDHLTSDVRQHETHKQLVGHEGLPAAARPARTLDAIVVPASRPALSLDHAITLARAARSRLLILCSRQAHAADVSKLLAARSFTQAVVLDLPNGYSHRLLRFTTSQLTHIGSPRRYAVRKSDLSVKRNIGLMLARMLGWESIFFMDDDIRDVDSADLSRTIAMLGTYNTVGMRVASFPDNSVVCHAHRRTGAFQDVSVSGSALAVDCTAPIDFFPEIYNEDWFFCYRDAAARKLGCSELNATQLRYDPFADPRRAASEEFGDVLAEGLYALLHQGADAREATRDYWIQFLDARRVFLEAIIKRSEVVERPLRKNLIAAVKAAQDVAARINPEMCESYVKHWQQDRRRWHKRLREIPRESSVAAALEFLGFAAPAGCLAQWADEAQAGPPVVSPAGPALIRSVTARDGMSRPPVLAGFAQNAVGGHGTAGLPESAGQGGMTPAVAAAVAAATAATTAAAAAAAPAAPAAPAASGTPATVARPATAPGSWAMMRAIAAFLQMCAGWRGRGGI